jgi:hypothetical protein
MPSFKPGGNDLPFEQTLGWEYLALDDYLRVSVYGRTATGKTTFASSFPKPILWLICSGGTQPGELRSINTPEMKKVVTPKVIRHSSEMLKAAEYAERSGRFQTVVMDHASGLASLIIAETKKLKEVPFAFAQSHAQEAKGMTMVTEQEWGFIGAECIKSLKPLLDLPLHCVIISQQKDTIPKRKDNQPDMSGEDILMPFIGSGITPMTVGWLNPAVDYIVGTFIRPKYKITIEEPKVKSANSQPVEVITRVKGKYEYCMRVGPHEIFTTKFRMPRGFDLPEAIVNPSFAKIQALSRGQEVNDD